MERDNLKAALLVEADLVGCGEKSERSVPSATIISQVQGLNVSREAMIWYGCFVVRKKEVVGPL